MHDVGRCVGLRGHHLDEGHQHLEHLLLGHRDEHQDHQHQGHRGEEQIRGVRHLDRRDEGHLDHPCGGHLGHLDHRGREGLLGLDDYLDLDECQDLDENHLGHRGEGHRERHDHLEVAELDDQTMTSGREEEERGEHLELRLGHAVASQVASREAYLAVAEWMAPDAPKASD